MAWMCCLSTWPLPSALSRKPPALALMLLLSLDPSFPPCSSPTPLVTSRPCSPSPPVALSDASC